MKIDFSNYEAVLFDFDGIFVDSEKIFFESFRRALQQQLNFDPSQDEYYYFWSMRGIGMHEYLEKKGIKLNEKEISKLESIRKKNYLDSCKNGEISFIEGMIEIVAKIKNKGLKVAIASNTPKEIIQLILDCASVTPPCDIVGKHPGLRGKPEPDIFVYASGFLQVDPVNCLVIEDALKGIIAAQKIQMKTILIRSGYWDEDHIYKPNFMFQNHQEFIDYIK